LNKKSLKMVDLDSHRAAILSKNFQHIVIFNKKVKFYN